jgi:N-acetyl-anhydromuramyl-L-alanine amidase AmpD
MPTMLHNSRLRCLARRYAGLGLIGACLLPTGVLAATARKHRPAPPEVLQTNQALAAAIAPTAGEPRWRYIVLHHTAAETDSLAGINAMHAKRFRDPLGIQYHFLIGNGRSAPDGAIQLARWQHHVESIHVVHPERAPTAITVSVQGNLHERVPSAAQMVAVETLVRRLMHVYAIPVERISTNTRVDGTFTVCPGRYFPIDRLLARLRQGSAATLADWREPLAPVPMDGPFADDAAILAGLRWDRPCNEPIAIGPLKTVQTLVQGNLQARVLELAGGRGCTAITRKFAVLHTPAGWWVRELNGYRSSRLKALADRKRAGVVVRDEQGPTQRCVAPDGMAPQCSPVGPRG